jgi:hypothetical protein
MDSMEKYFHHNTATDLFLCQTLVWKLYDKKTVCFHSMPYHSWIQIILWHQKITLWYISLHISTNIVSADFASGSCRYNVMPMVKCPIKNNLIKSRCLFYLFFMFFFGWFLFVWIFGVLTPLSTIFQLYHGDQF